MKKLFALFCMLLAGTLLGATDSSRAQQGAQPDASVETSRFDNWTVRCVSAQERRCQMFQQITIQQNEQRVPFLSVTLTEERIRIQVPPGLALRQPVELATANDEIAIPYTICTQQGCFAGDPTDAEMIAAFQRGEVLKVKLGRLEAEPLTFDVSLIGFSQAYAKMQAN